MVTNKKIIAGLGVGCALLIASCRAPQLSHQVENKNVPVAYNTPRDSANTARVKWKDFFTDANLIALIDTALKNNQELNIMLQEIRVSNYEVMARKGAYLPMVGLQGGAGVEKTARYTRNGAVDATTNIDPAQKNPDLLPDFLLAANVTWEVDIWKKLRNARKSAIYKYLSTTEGKNFMVTNLVAEIATSYYELMALDNQLMILKNNIEIQQNALEIVKLEKVAARVTELAVKRFEAEVLKNQSRQYAILQSITETENRINFLVGRFPQPVARSSQGFNELAPDTIHSGIPTQLLENRPDIRQAEMDLLSAKLDVKVARANFYPSLIISGIAGYEAFNPKFLLNPESMILAAAGQLVAPLINRNAIKAVYYSASSRQVQAVYNYERTILNGYVEVANQLANINNLRQSYALKAQQVQALTQSITISTNLFKSARADYMEVLLTQRDALEARFELVETKMQQMNARVNVYRALGGGWR
jgi:NodT family efflux transporter outer membrane factor (OMF) lipoprotein